MTKVGGVTISNFHCCDPYTPPNLITQYSPEYTMVSPEYRNSNQFIYVGSSESMVLLPLYYSIIMCEGRKPRLVSITMEYLCSSVSLF